MFKSWSKKNKLKAVFKMQFQATQVPKLKKPSLMISLIPDDVGKPTVKLEKVAVQDGTCLWENPIFESVKLIRDAKSGKINEKIYHFVVSTGSSKSGFLGEASIDFADFVTESEPLTVALPLKFANSGAILNVTIQNIEGPIDQRVGEGNGTLTLPNEGSLRSQISNTDQSFCNFAEELDSEYNDKDVKASVQDHSRFLPAPSKGTTNANFASSHAHWRSNSDWSFGSGSDGSLGGTNMLDESLSSKRLQDPSNNSVEELKNEIASLVRQAEVSELELQSLRKQIAKENNRGQDLSRQIISLTEERDALKTQSEQLKSRQSSNNVTETRRKSNSDIKDAKVQLEAVRKELTQEKELRTNLQLQLQKRQNSNPDLILAVGDLEALLEQKNKEILDLSRSVKSQNNAEEVWLGSSSCKMTMNENHSSLGESTLEHHDAQEVDLLKQKITELNMEIDFYRKQSEEMDEHVKQLTAQHECMKSENQDISLKLKEKQTQQTMAQKEIAVSMARISELELHVEILEEKLKKQTDELSESLMRVDELESEVRYLKEDLEVQAQTFKDDLDTMECAKIKQEERANQAEDALRKARHNNAAMADNYQEEYRRLSVEMASKVEGNEELIKKALKEADELKKQNKILEEMLQQSNKEIRQIKHQSELKLHELLSQLDMKGEMINQISSELEYKCKQLEDAQNKGERKDEEFSTILLTLRTRMEKLIKEKCNTSRHEATKYTEASSEKKPVLKQELNKERDLEKQCILSQDNANTRDEEQSYMTRVEMEKVTSVSALLSEVEILITRYSELKGSFHKEELENWKFKEENDLLKGELNKKEKEVRSMEKKLAANQMSQKGRQAGNPSAKRGAVRENGSYSPMTTAERMSAKNRPGITSPRSEVETGSTKERNALSYPNGSESLNSELLTEMEVLKERNKNMENELKEMQERYSEISLRFAEVEGERQQLVMELRNLKNGKKN